MRIAFGLVSLLVMVAILLILFKTVSLPTIKQGQKAKAQARQISGRSDDDTPAERSIKLLAEPDNGPVRDLLVDGVTPGGAMDKFYGLKKGDKITAIGESDVGMWNDPALASAMLVQEGFEKMQPITVVRDGQTIQLPLDAAGTRGRPNARRAPDSSLGSQQKSIENQIKGLNIPAQQP